MPLIDVPEWSRREFRQELGELARRNAAIQASRWRRSRSRSRRKSCCVAFSPLPRAESAPRCASDLCVRRNVAYGSRAAVARCDERVGLAPESRPTASSINHLFSANKRPSPNHLLIAAVNPSRLLLKIEPSVTAHAPHLPFARLWWPLARTLSGEAAKPRRCMEKAAAGI